MFVGLPMRRAGAVAGSDGRPPVHPEQERPAEGVLRSYPLIPMHPSATRGPPGLFSTLPQINGPASDMRGLGGLLVGPGLGMAWDGGADGTFPSHRPPSVAL